MKPKLVLSSLDHLATQIRDAHGRAQEAARMSVEHAIRAGRLLAEAKPLLKHGEWTDYLEKKCRLPARTAQIYLKLHRAYGGEKTAALRLSSIREALRLLTQTHPQEDSGCYLDADSVLPLPKEAVSRLGDLWQLGEHRLLCGDATSAEAVARLLGDRQPRLMVTDPPYGVSLDLGWRNRAHISSGLRETPGHAFTEMRGDARADWSEAFALAPSINVAYVWHASSRTAAVYSGLQAIGFEQFQQLIWDKGHIVLGRTLYSYQHESIWFARRKNASWYGQRGQQSTVWRCEKADQKFEHPSQKPVELFRRAIENHTRRGELLYDPFVGSGTTIAAAELTGRVAVAMEIDPKFVDVAIQRWMAMTGRIATLQGRSFEVVAGERLGRAQTSTQANVAS